MILSLPPLARDPHAPPAGRRGAGPYLVYASTANVVQPGGSDQGDDGPAAGRRPWGEVRWPGPFRPLREGRGPARLVRNWGERDVPPRKEKAMHNMIERYSERHRDEALSDLRAELREFSHDGLVQLREDLARSAVVRGSWAGCVISYKRGAPG